MINYRTIAMVRPNSDFSLFRILGKHLLSLFKKKETATMTFTSDFSHNNTTKEVIKAA